MTKTVLVVGMALLWLVGCGGGSDVDKVCDHLTSLKMADKPGADAEREKKYKEKCAKEFGEMLPKCKDRAKVVECYLALKDRGGRNECSELCGAR